MTLPCEKRVRIRQLYFGEHWRIGTIAEQLGVHPDAVHNAINYDTFANVGCCRPSALDPFVPFIREILERYPRLTGTRVHEMVRERGYGGSAVQVRRRIRRDGLRPRPNREAFFRLRTLPGEQGQVDWGYLGTVRVGDAERKVWMLVVVLSWSRAVHVHFSHEQGIAAVLRGHIEAFDAFGGVPRTLLYDNMKTVVVEREGDAIRFHPRLLELSAHYLFSAQPCNFRRGNEKGRVERRIRYLRTSFLAGRTFTDLEDMRRQFGRWRDEVAYARRCPDDESLTVAEALEREREALLPLPENPLDAEETRTVLAHKQPYVRFDTNLYSLPHDLVGQPLLLSASDRRVRLLDGEKVVAEHERCWGRRQTIEDPRHLAGLAESKRRAAALRGRASVLAEIPEAEALYQALAERDEPLGPQTAALRALLERHPPEDVASAIREALDRGTPRAVSVQSILERRRREACLGPEPPVRVSPRSEIQDLRVRNHSLEDYDELIDARADA